MARLVDTLGRIDFVFSTPFHNDEIRRNTTKSRPDPNCHRTFRNGQPLRPLFNVQARVPSFPGESSHRLTVGTRTRPADVVVIDVQRITARLFQRRLPRRVSTPQAFCLHLNKSSTPQNKILYDPHPFTYHLQLQFPYNPLSVYTVISSAKRALPVCLELRLPPKVC